MHLVLTLVRALHYASLVSLAGGLGFIVFVADPALGGRGDPAAAGAFGARLMRLLWASLVLGLLSGAAWLVLEARSMSGRSLAEVCSQGVVGVVLARTHFGQDWALRGILAVPLALCLLLAGRSKPAALAQASLWAALALGAAELALIAGAGHAAAGEGWAGILQLAGDVAHLLAAGTWLGGLLPLALLFAAARRGEDAGAALAARDATRRFSTVGLIAVGTLLATGILNALFLVGNLPALLGTDYGHLLMLKIALFLTMVAFAAINRQWLMPLLAADPGGAGTPANRGLLRQLQRNALVEAGLGAAVLMVVGVLGTTPPALHVQPEWPLPFSLSLATLEAEPALRLQAIAAGVVALGGLGLLVYGLLRPSQRTLPILVGLFVFVAVGWWPLQFMIVTAYPTSFYRSAVPFTASSIERGARAFAANCVACHGADGRGDGPLAKSLPVKPADLTAPHIFGHSDGDLFWWITHGIPTGAMPGFAAVLDEGRRWSVINFIHARAAALQPRVLLPEVTAGPAPLAPDFAFERGGRQDTLHEAAERAPVLLVLYRLPGSEPRLGQLAASEKRLAAAGLRLLALPLDAAAKDAESGAALPDFAAIGDAATTAAYALFEGKDPPAECEFLVDRAGYLRARWRADAAPLPDEAALLVQLDRLARMKLQPPQAHVHAH